jgi:2',3'-cyclic-nucleotide 2'-phosphodiesterase (5'-nucleotidase family)
MFRFFVYIILTGAGLTACSSVSTYRISSERIDVVSNGTRPTALDSLIQPYQDSVKKEMSEVLAIADTNFFILRKPSGNLNNWVSDAIFVNQTRNVRLSEPTFCLLNNGGIRSTLNKGEITKGDIYKLMPFDNEIVWVKLPIEVLKDIEDYLMTKGGEPVSNANMSASNLEINGLLKESTHFWVITSDYLMNGGDNMRFFEKRVDVMYPQKLLRDALLEEAKNQGTLISVNENRMNF